MDQGTKDTVIIIGAVFLAGILGSLVGNFIIMKQLEKKKSERIEYLQKQLSELKESKRERYVPPRVIENG